MACFLDVALVGTLLFLIDGRETEALLALTTPLLGSSSEEPPSPS